VFLALLCDAAFYLVIKSVLTPRSVVLPDIQLTSHQTTNLRLPMLSGDLFGELPNAAKNLVETRLNLVLKGTMPAFNLAMIKVGTKPEKTSVSAISC